MQEKPELSPTDQQLINDLSYFPERVPAYEDVAPIQEIPPQPTEPHAEQQPGQSHNNTLSQHSTHRILRPIVLVRF